MAFKKGAMEDVDEAFHVGHLEADGGFFDEVEVSFGVLEAAYCVALRFPRFRVDCGSFCMNSVTNLARSGARRWRWDGSFWVRNTSESGSKGFWPDSGMVCIISRALSGPASPAKRIHRVTAKL